ncbi:tRNA-guanine transglycosylase DpdA [Vibrio pomeroyi]|uniref:tRNA-guanine transglycosylase DpdA n=1 Tax=Vibrio pomeroyi TaxID=198832 RepID=UPI0021C3A585|nr:tRNA-guanine transglycosylase DpdA [Vibrio pomeroyi]
MTQFRFYFPDNKDFVDPEFDGRDNSRTKHHRTYDDDHYPHQILTELPFDGMLVSLAGVGTMQKRGKYYEQELTEDFYFLGAREFLRLNKPKFKDVKLMGDCGAFDYHAEKEPPFTIEELIEFYDRGGFDYGISLDHIVFPYFRNEEAKDEFIEKSGSHAFHELIQESERRIKITLDNAKVFLEKSKPYSFQAYGVAHGYDQNSFLRSVKELQEMGYRRITIGGMIKAKTDELLELLEQLGEIRHPETQFHLLGICRFDNIPAYVNSGVTSADSTSPLMQGLKGGKYYTLSENEENAKLEESLMIRVRQCDHDNVQKHIEKYRDELQQHISQMGQNNEYDINLSNTALSVHECVKRLEVDCLKKLRYFDETALDLEGTLKALIAYEKVTNEAYLPSKSTPSKVASLARNEEKYRAFLEQREWRQCACGICKGGLMNIIFRSNQSNRRRGIHNLAIVTKHKNRVIESLEPAAK